MRKISGILSVIVTILLVMVFFRYLPFASRVEDLTESGAGLELGEWQVSVGIFLTAVVLFAILSAILFRIGFATSLTIVSGLVLCGVAGAVWCLYSLRSKTGILNQHGHGLTYDEWWASVIPWTITLGLAALCAISSLIHLVLERRKRQTKPAAVPSHGGPATRVGNARAAEGPPLVS